MKALQERHGSRSSYHRMEMRTEDGPHLPGEEEAGFIAARDSFYMATVSKTGWPYVQHRGGPTGFLKVLDERTIGFADFRGNRQYVSTGNLLNDDRYSAMHGSSNQAELPKPSPCWNCPTTGQVERGILIRVAAIDWNCPSTSCRATPRNSPRAGGKHDHFN